MLCFRRFPGAKKFKDKRGGRRGGVSRFSVVIIVKNVGEGWDSNPYLALQNPVLLHTVPREPLEFQTNVSEIIKKMTRRRLEPGPTGSEPCCPTHCAMVIIGMEFLTNASEIIKIFGTTETRTRTFRWRTMLS